MIIIRETKNNTIHLFYNVSPLLDCLRNLNIQDILVYKWVIVNRNPLKLKPLVCRLSNGSKKPHVSRSLPKRATNQSDFEHY